VASRERKLNLETLLCEWAPKERQKATRNTLDCEWSQTTFEIFQAKHNWEEEPHTAKNKLVEE
jgi:hypothetical protein